eukprot:2348683-Rhodomonas_salina.1
MVQCAVCGTELAYAAGTELAYGAVYSSRTRTSRSRPPRRPEEAGVSSEGVYAARRGVCWAKGCESCEGVQ